MSDKKRILIAEDEKPMAKALQLKLNNMGFEAEIAGNGEEALEMLKNGNFDLLVLDLMMPKVDGFGVLTELKNQGSSLPVIVASNLSQPDDAKRARDLGARDFFVKSNTQIIEVIGQIKNILGIA